MSVELFYEQGRWVARCAHCGGPLTGADEQADLEAVLVALGVYPPEPVEVGGGVRWS
jgi:hypothetical protein